MRSVSALIAVVFLSLFLMLPGHAAAQSATTGAIVGTVTDPQQAAIAGAEVEIVNNDTKQSQRQTTGASGQYSFPRVPPGTYKVSVTMKGFRTATIQDLKVAVEKSYTLDLRMELGVVSDVVQVEATAHVELQTTDATVGNVLSVGELKRFPALTRQVNELLTLQPGTTPTGEVTGARSDQSSFTLDGIDVTNNSVGGLGTYTFLPIDAIEEFRVSVANPSASFGRGAGGQVSLVSRAGTDQYHGSAYWYHQNDNFNANSWDNNRLHIKNPELKDNRFGGRAGGPVPFFWHKKTFIFANYEGRRFPSTSLQSRIVPTDTLKQGILQFTDATGAIRSYNLATSTACGATGTTACDPRGLGLSPSISALWKLLPSGNDPSVTGADGLNTTGFTTNVGTPLKNDFYDIKLDQNVTSKWHADASFRYFRQSQISALQLDIINGTPSTVRSLPVRQNMLIGGLSGQITSRLTGDFRFGWVRERDATSPERPNLVAAQEAIAGTNTPAGAIALDLGAAGGTHSLLDEPIDVGTQVARKQSNDNRNFQWNADFNWALGKHTWQFGTQVHFLPTLHLRDDKVIGALGALVAQLDADIGSSVVIPGADRPQPCAGAVTTNCIRATDVQQWDRLYAGSLGLIDNISVLAVRDGSFNPLPFGSQLESDTKLWAPEMYVQDVWRLKPTLTLILGVNYGWQTAPVERLGRQTIQIDAGTGQPITAASFLNQRKQAAANGQIFNPTFGFVPINSANRPVFNVDYGDIGPRVAVAWNPSRSGGFTGRMFGSGKTVIRAGFGIIYDRQNTVQSVIIPALGIGFAQTLNLSGPACNITGPGGAGCNAANANPAVGVFRVGQDGTMPVPVVPAQGNPVVPVVTFNPVTGAINSPEVFSFQDDPSIKVGRNYAADLSVQRELPGNMILDVAFSGRHGRQLPQSMSLGQSPINFKDPTSGQVFAQAFDAVASQLRSGVAAASVTPQPWFQNLVPGGTVALATAASASFINGNVSSVFKTIDQRRLLASLPTFNNYLASGIFFRSSTGESNYDALLVTLNKRTSHGLTLTANYTFSRSFDQIGAIQNAANLMPNSFDLNAEYGPSPFDFRHIFNANWVYDLPFRASNHYLSRAVKGWYVSGIFTTISGQPLTVTEGSQVWGGTQQLGFNSGAIPTVDPTSLGDGVHKGVAGSAGCGTNSPAAINLFGNPGAVCGDFRKVLIATDARGGRSNPFRGLGHWNLDTSVGKTTAITERLHATFAADFFNIFNHVIYCDPGQGNGNGGACGGSLNLNTLSTFGVISSQWVPANRVAGSRWIQLSVRFEF
ncbi:MAG TPA: TonB-dependent receptor [Candidatus Acidoferrales bacterium]|nr:TonB-dependent receptor [Candidatus Acidoferrales bacterium]